MGSPHGAAVLQEKICSSVGSKRTGVEICSTMGCSPSVLWHLEHLFPLLLLWSWSSLCCFSPFCPHAPSFACVAGLALSKIGFPRDDTNLAEGLSCPAGDPLEPSGTGCVQHRAALVSSLRGFCNPSAANTSSGSPNRASNDI